MPTEAINCTGCGSGDVKEVKAGTYFCSHCESVFKYVDPSIVTTSPTFCGCGNSITAQCNLCESGICGECDVLALKQDRYSGESSWPGSNWVIPVRGQGYRDAQTGSPAVVYAPFVAEQDRHEPVMSVGKIVAVIRQNHPHLRHVCWPCIYAAANTTLDAVAARAICPTPDCDQVASVACECCKSRMCAVCVQSRALAIIQIHKREINAEVWPEGPTLPEYEQRLFEVENVDSWGRTTSALYAVQSPPLCPPCMRSAFGLCQQKIREEFRDGLAGPFGCAPYWWARVNSVGCVYNVAVTADLWIRYKKKYSKRLIAAVIAEDEQAVRDGDKYKHTLEGQILASVTNSPCTCPDAFAIVGEGS